MTTEPSLLDYLLAKIQFWKKSEIDFSQYLLFEQMAPEAVDEEGRDFIAKELKDLPFSSEEETVEATQSKNKWDFSAFPWRLLVSLTLILAGQSFMEPPEPDWKIALALYLVSASLLVWSFLKKELTVKEKKAHEVNNFDKVIRPIFLLGSIPFLLTAFLLMGLNRFTFVNLTAWLVGILFVITGFWADVPDLLTTWKQKFSKAFNNRGVRIRIRWWDVLLVLTAVLIIFFRTNQLQQVPAEMFSDHAEKLLDVQDVLDGIYPIYFPRNTGREGFQMYLSAFVARYLGVGITSMTLKIGTVLMGLLMLPYMYLLGKELFNKRVGFYALLLIGIAYWPNVIARVGLRYILYAAFTAPTLYHLLRGLRHQNRNDFIIAGIFLGVGLHGYSSFRFVPIAVILTVAFYLLHHVKQKKKINNALFGLLIIGLVSLVIFLPLLRYWISNPAIFSYRIATRLGTAERGYPGNPIIIFLQNFLNASLMFFSDGGHIWVHSVIKRPALDFVSAGFYFVGVLYALLSYIKQRSWEKMSILVSIPLLLMPSILSLAFPEENPSLNRPSAAIVPVFLLAGVGMDAILGSIKRGFQSKGGSLFVVFLTVILLFISASANYGLVFDKYAQQFRLGAWNTSDIGRVIDNYANSVGDYESAYVIPYPHWVDTRLVGVNAGQPRKDYALPPGRIGEVTETPGPKLFIFRFDDKETFDSLTNIYPIGILSYFESELPGKDFYMLLVP
ncbi:MAG TPA: hypothetical protein ENN32_08855 [Chloroflexi bacterium]|nr:hypothetical protein [Chloroflexota bacterium]